MILPQNRLKTLFIAVCIYFLFSALYPLSAHSFEKTFTNALGMEFVLIPAGTFVMGSPVDELNRDESEIQHKMTISKPFYIQTAEVTVKQWRTVMGKKLLSLRQEPDTMPATKVSWYDSIEFIKGLNQRSEGTYRLPTEAEWEYAARAGSTTAYSWGNDIDCNKAMYGNSMKHDVCQLYNKSVKLELGRPAPVKSYQPNAWGVYDMHGNVWEWVMDRHEEYSSAPAVDPRGPDSGTMRVKRGGSWFKYGNYCRSANRAFAHPAGRFQTTGFRVVREVGK
ncbi:MAG: formylglycine-generating enzyme family protein [Desulfobacterales bacterium]|uniref:Formylglycine-generating enzyme family protein n=1 Tax=Candidatus Desulfatibia vada TaxID=2841696 RepID=A0A8J6P5S1_9BACT|nr:formylglycine-generating enzyme family protein [Candidatus Desulfatibia vada]MBL6971477.1 formylglycine-generating enzyme family protein [Desulfobacterales bacterium]